MTQLFLRFWNVSTHIQNFAKRTRISSMCRPIF